MSNAGKTVVNWRRDFPELRVALGLLGADGYRSMHVAHFLVWHERLAPIREYYTRICGRELQGEVLHSRLRRPEELAWIKENRPLAHRRGETLKKVLLADVQKAKLAKS
jgi:hypothetical protein